MTTEISTNTCAPPTRHPKPIPNPNPSTKQQHATVSIQLNIVIRPIRFQRNSYETMLSRRFHNFPLPLTHYLTENNTDAQKSLCLKCPTQSRQLYIQGTGPKVSHYVQSSSLNCINTHQRYIFHQLCVQNRHKNIISQYQRLKFVHKTSCTPRA